MLPIAIGVLVLGVGYAVSLAPPDQRVVVAVVFLGLAGAGFGGGWVLTDVGTPQRDYYPIAGAIGGAMIAFAWVSKKQKIWKEARKRAK